MKGLGIGIAIVGALVAGYALVIFDPSRPSGTGSGRVNNFGLLQDRQNLLLAGGIACIVGALMALLGKQKPNLEWKSEALTARKDSNLPSAAEEQFKKALEWDDVSTLDQLLSSGSVSVSGKLPTGSSFLQYAVLARSKKAIALLLEKGASAKDALHNSARSVLR